MAPKKATRAKRKGAPSPSPAKLPRKKEQKQQGIEAALAHKRPQSATVSLEAAAPPPTSLDAHALQEICKCVDKYREAWGQKGSLLNSAAAGRRASWASPPKAPATRGARNGGAAPRRGDGPDPADPDHRAFQLLDTIRRGLAAAQAGGAAAALDPPTLEALVLLCRSDCMHQSPEVSRQAFALLCAQLEAHPYASVAGGGSGDADGGGLPCLLTCADAAWLPLLTDRSGFSARHLLVPDMLASAKAWHAQRAERSRQRAPIEAHLSSAFHLLAHLFGAVLRSEEEDLNGDLMLLSYLLQLYTQDLRARLAVFAATAGAGEAVAGKRSALLTSSLAWRTWADTGIGPEEKQGLVKQLVQLIVATGGEEALLAVEEGGSSDEERGGGGAGAKPPSSPLDEDAAAACFFSRRELAALAARCLNLLLELFGTAEAAGMFHNTARARAASVNHRMALDVALQRCFWGEDAVCGTDGQSRALLAALAPRDGLRFLGLLAAAKHARMWERGTSSTRAAGLESLERGAWLLEHGAEAAGFVDVDALEVAKSVNLDLGRAVKVYANVDRLTVLVAGVALGVHAQLAQSGAEGLTCLAAGAAALPELAAQLRAALRGIAERSREPGAAHCLSPGSAFDLVHAEMALVAMVAAA